MFFLQYKTATKRWRNEKLKFLRRGSQINILYIQRLGFSYYISHYSRLSMSMNIPTYIFVSKNYELGKVKYRLTAGHVATANAFNDKLFF